jgi:uncharacterized low-complexity protein
MAHKASARSLTLGAALAASLVAAATVAAAENPFKLEPLSSGYQVADNKAKEGKCGDDAKKKDGSCGGDAKKKEGKCGEGKCGGNK